MYVCIDPNAYWKGIATCRRQMHHINKRHLLVIDQTGVKGSLCANYSLAPSKRIHKTPTYSLRYDVMGSLLVDHAFPVNILTPADKTESDIRGYTKELLLSYFTNIVAPELITLDRKHGSMYG